MTTAAQHQQNQQSHSHIGFVGGDTYDPDEVVPRGSPLMTPLRPKLEPSPTPSPDIPPAQVSLSPSSIDGLDNKANRHKVRPSSGDAVLVTYLDNGRHPEIARTAGRLALQYDENCPDDVPPLDEPPSGAVNAVMTVPNLQHLAADALQVAYADVRAQASKSIPDISISTNRLSLRDDLPVGPYPTRDLFPATELKPDAKPHPSAVLTPGELPPIQPMDSPRSESNGQMLPSIRSTLGDIDRLPADPLAQTEKDIAIRHGPGSSFPRSPPAGMGRFPPMATNHGSPPVSPNDNFARNQLPSPHSLTSSPYYYTTNGIQHRPSVEYSSSTTGETPSTDQSGSTPATSTSVAERMSIDGITNPQVGHYVCTFSGCTAAPFQTQYLLNSHANVHSSARPHYCSVQGCPRSEGGKGFKRKNEMIRHGLVHDSPGYVCPFCPDREHKYPRPDNLQRHVRVHHVDKDKDDPLLRDVLSQRPDGPNRGRRRRAPPA
ncbi:Fc.00g075730.m01.CDS01 [Cosmosporella sp. VM-42]